MYSWPVRNHQVYTVKYSSCLTLISHTHQVLSDVIISHISTSYSLLSWRRSCLSLSFQSILWKRRGNWPINWSVFNSFNIMLYTIHAFFISSHHKFITILELITFKRRYPNKENANTWIKVQIYHQWKQNSTNLSFDVKNVNKKIYSPLLSLWIQTNSVS